LAISDTGPDHGTRVSTRWANSKRKAKKSSNFILNAAVGPKVTDCLRNRTGRTYYHFWFGKICICDLSPHRLPQVWHRTRPHLPAQSFTRYKDALVPSPAAFQKLSTSLLFSSPLPPSCTALSCLRLCGAPLTPLPGPLAPTESIRCSQWEKCRSATADSYSLDASAVLSRRPLAMTPIKRPRSGRSSAT
jgi:hypothetical protein